MLYQIPYQTVVYRLLLPIFLLITCASFSSAQTKRSTHISERTTTQYQSSSFIPGGLQQTKQGFNIKAWLGNNSTVGRGAFYDLNPPDGIGFEYPIGSGIEHLFGFGPWIGTIVDTGRKGAVRTIRTVTAGYDYKQDGYYWEMRGYQTKYDTFYRTSIFQSNVPNRRFFDDDNDGKIDEDDLDGVDNDGDGKIDEDYGAVSESDIYVSYTDTFTTPVVMGHVPLGIKVWQKSYAWGSRVKEPIIVMEYNFINVGERVLDSVYVGFFADVFIGPIFSGASILSHKYAAYLPEVRTGYASNAVDRPSTPFGVTILGTPKPLDSLRYTFQWNNFSDHPTTKDAMYQYMSSGTIKPDEPFEHGSDAQFFLGFGSFNALRPGDTLKVSLALISGQGIFEGLNNLKENAVKALELYNRGFQTPEVPPSPPLHIIKGNDQVTLNWQWRPGDPKFDPLETWDDSNKFVETLPDTHWRKRNPPDGKTHGGRIFEGFRLWRSEAPIYNPSTFALLKQFDVADDLGFEGGTGLEYTYTDSHLVRGRRYWYAVTSFSIPGASILILPDPGGGPPKIDTLVTASVESDVSENVSLIQLPFLPSEKVGDVKVVPNPYRSNADYTFEGGGWEGFGRFWTENRRVIWFVHLPPRCTIRIFSLAGDVVGTIEHDDKNRTTPDKPIGQEEWNLLSESGRAIASGVYVYTVESDLGKQIGKFVVIR